MASYKYGKYLLRYESDQFDKEFEPGSIPYNSGIYRCRLNTGTRITCQSSGNCSSMQLPETEYPDITSAAGVPVTSSPAGSRGLSQQWVFHSQAARICKLEA